MRDEDIIGLYWKRDEHAISESQQAYGGYCSALAYRILASSEDAEECVNDTWLRAWNAIPPQQPVHLRQFFGRITRNLAFKKSCGNSPSFMWEMKATPCSPALNLYEK